ncbi:outer membrane beta-barrel protein [Photobacterium kishitanii]|uniref:Outer membrane protein beta-barrel domain-containing protein n=1 Tax=Photobacterium kishitanii TaxID=318456 RepID=A0A2T3KFC8_9GAMM|nr:outer membrane beta-barrel protein [Photobacterium kishitanii]PSU85232.1 hypothetical protein C0W42_21455 [Photobacterium kishitanii]PSU96554.1 hypothetical protein C9J27_16570 [Photobacterium kishitanii]
MKLVNGLVTSLLLISLNVSAQERDDIFVGAKVGISNVDFNSYKGSKSGSGVDYGLEFTWLHNIYQNISLGINLSLDRFENQLYGKFDSNHSSLIISPIISYRIVALTPKYLGKNYIRYHDGLSVYFKLGLGLAQSDITYSNGSMRDDGAIDSWGLGLKWQSTSNWAIGIEYSQLDNHLWGLGEQNYSLKNKSVMGIINYRFDT